MEYKIKINREGKTLYMTDGGKLMTFQSKEKAQDVADMYLVRWADAICEVVRHDGGAK